MFDLLARLPHPRYRRTLQRFANLQHQSCPTLPLALDGQDMGWRIKSTNVFARSVVRYHSTTAGRFSGSMNAYGAELW